jgi:hypothetical protein
VPDEGVNWNTGPKMEIERDDIRRFIRDRKIRRLYHFTTVGNLDSILEHGIIPRRDLSDRGINAHLNDDSRADGQLDRSCLSIEHPNIHLLNRFKERNPTERFVVLEITSRLLWKRNCLFTHCNAARLLGPYSDVSGYIGLSALQKLFAYQPDFWERVDTTLDRWPTDDQAEVLVRGRVSASWIKCVHFETAAFLITWLWGRPTTPLPVAATPSLFDHRPDKDAKRHRKGLIDG